MTYKSNCFVCETTFEWQSSKMTTEDPPCPECGGPTDRGYFPVAAVWSKPLVAYQDSKKEFYGRDQALGGHVVFEKNSDQAKSEGRIIKRVIRTPQDQSDYVRREGLVHPKDLPSNLTVDKSGTGYETANRSEV